VPQDSPGTSESCEEIEAEIQVEIQSEVPSENQAAAPDSELPWPKTE